jgi:hypothetical protein
MLRKVWVLLWPLLLNLIVLSACLGAICLFGLVLYFLSGGGAAEAQRVWLSVRPVVLSGGTLFAVLAVLRWALHLAGLRGKLRETQTSLREYSSWPIKVRTAWLKGEKTT